MDIVEVVKKSYTAQKKHLKNKSKTDIVNHFMKIKRIFI